MISINTLLCKYITDKHKYITDKHKYITDKHYKYITDKHYKYITMISIINTLL